MKSPVLAFFNGAFDLLDAAFTASRELSNASKGASREHAARELLRDLLPSVTRVESGDIVDSWGQQSGQLDAVVIDHRAPTLRLGSSEAGLILAEGAIAVLEIKSTLSSQWNQVLRTYSKVAPIRPRVRVVGKSARQPPSELFERLAAKERKNAEEERAIPFIVLAGKGWSGRAALEERCLQLFRSTKAAGESKVIIVTLRPTPTVAVAAGDQVTCEQFETDRRGLVLGELWYWLVRQARWHSRANRRLLEVERYFNPIPPSTEGSPQSPAAKRRPPRLHATTKR